MEVLYGINLIMMIILLTIGYMYKAGRLQKRAGMGLRAIKFRKDGDELVGLRVLGKGGELLLVSERGVIVRTSADKISQQSRAATGVRIQTLMQENIFMVCLTLNGKINTKNNYFSFNLGNNSTKLQGL